MVEEILFCWRLFGCELNFLDCSAYMWCFYDCDILAGIYNLNNVISILVIEKCTTVQGSVSQYRMAFLWSLIL